MSVFADGRYGYIDKTGRFAIEPQFTSAREFADGLALVKIGGVLINPVGATIMNSDDEVGRYAFIDKTGKTVLSLPGIRDVDSFSDGLARINMKGREGFIDTSGNIVIEPKLSVLSNFSEGLAPIILSEGGIGFIDKTGKIVIKTKFPLAGDFKNGLAFVHDSLETTSSRYGYIDKVGKIVWKPTK